MLAAMQKLDYVFYHSGRLYVPISVNVSICRKVLKLVIRSTMFVFGLKTFPLWRSNGLVKCSSYGNNKRHQKDFL